MTGGNSNFSRRQFLGRVGAGAAAGLYLASAPPAWASKARADVRDGGRGRKRFSADLILVNGKILTVDKRFSEVEAVAIADGRFLAVGNTRDVMRFKAAGTEVIDLKGKRVLPGINDAHIHLLSFGLSRPPFVLDLGFPLVRNIPDIVNAIAQRVGQVKPGTWIRGGRWDEAFIDELRDRTRLPKRQDLDPVSPVNPVFLMHRSFHGAWANSRALELAGVTRNTADPSGGSIVRDANGDPTGYLLENAAGLISSVIPPASAAEAKQATIAAMRELNSLGVTSATDPGLGAAEVARYNELYLEGKLSVRSNLLLRWPHPAGGNAASMEALEAGARYVGTRSGFGDEWLRIGGYKITADGVPPLKTALMREPYIGGGRSALKTAGNTDDERYNTLINMIVFLHKARYQVQVHSAGDAAADAAVDGFVKAMQEDPWPDARHVIIHGNFLRPETARRMAPHGFTCVTDSIIRWQAGSGLRRVLDEARVRYHCPYKSLLEAGIHLADSSDAPVTYPDWRRGIQNLTKRIDRATEAPLGPEEAISMKDAIRAWTIEGAYQDKMETVKGSIEVGKLADLVVLGADIMRARATEFPDIPIDMTVVGGDIVHRRR